MGSTATRLKAGDRVCGVSHGAKFKDKGANAYYVKWSEDDLLMVPESLSLPEAATFGVGFGTAGMVSLP